jgi:hypothetical protein
MMDGEEQFTRRRGAARFGEDKHFLEFHRSMIDAGGGF